MSTTSDTLNIGTIRLKKDYPVAAVQAAQASSDPENHPAAVAAARARIAALPETYPLLDAAQVPATPTADLITDRQLLATRHDAVPTVTPNRRQLPTVLAPILTAIGVFALILLLFKAPIILSQVSYSLNKPQATPALSAAPAAAIIPAAPTITIPKIDVHAPVVYEPSVDEAAVQKALENGVVHYGNTAVPGQNGNVAIFGHSSNDWWEPGNYKFVFVLLDKLAPGDQISIDYQSKRYTYQVTGSKIVDPTDISVLDQTSTPTLSIITCTPPGTSLRRLVVTAKQIDPDPTKVAAPTVAPTASATNSAQLPSSAPSFLKQIGQAWDGIKQGFSSLFGGASSTTNSPTATPVTPASGQLPAVK